MSVVNGYKKELAGAAKDISFVLSADEITLRGNQAISCGQIIGELIANSLTHAFPGDRSGSVEVSLRRRNAATIELAVADDGIGLPENFDPMRADTLGMKLVSALAQQLGGELGIGNGTKTSFQITFPEDPR
jgi:two-component sensor histidine kinase